MAVVRKEAQESIRKIEFYDNRCGKIGWKYQSKEFISCFEYIMLLKVSIYIYVYFKKKISCF